MISKKEILELDIRKKIYNYIYKNPGSYLSEIARKLKVHKNTANYHIKFLEKRNIIESQIDYRYSRYYISNSISKDEKKILNLIRQKTPRNILLSLLLIGGGSQTEISEYSERHPTTIRHYLKKLEKLGLIKKTVVLNGLIENSRIEKNISSSEKIYTLVDKYFIYRCFLKFENKIKDETLKEFLLYFKFIISGKKPERFRCSKKTVDSFFKLAFEIFPLPYQI